MKLGEVLLNQGLISADQLQLVLNEQEQSNQRLGDIVLKRSLLSADEFLPALATYFDIPYIALKDRYKEIDAEIINLVPEDLARRFTVFPVDCNENVLVLAMYDPLDLEAIDVLRMKTGFKIRKVLASREQIQEAIDYCFHNMVSMQQQVDNFIDSDFYQMSVDVVDEDHEDASAFMANDQPVVQYVKTLIFKAMSNNVSDIHLSPKQDEAALRFRVHGVLHDFEAPPKPMLAAINTRIKILAGMDIAEKRLPQDGRFKASFGSKEVDVRVSSFPTIYGESVVLRLLDVSGSLCALDQLGFVERDYQLYNEMVHHSYGLILVTGPTGSGKTTTLYSSLNAIEDKQKKIITLEDPVEYRLKGIQQTQVKPQIGFDFARGLRSILRQDPDIIMVGEIRDKETAEIAIHAALTGHLVFSTLHTNDAAGAAVRLVNMGIEPFLITSSLLGVIGQRLIRTICPACKEPHHVDGALLQKFPALASVKKFYHGKGCPECMQSGYNSREGVYELLAMNEEIRQMILEKRSSDEVRQVAQRNGMRTIHELSLDKVKQGRTTPDEALRISRESREE